MIIKTIEEGIEILTGMPAGKRTWNGETKRWDFEKDTLFFKVNEKLRFLVELEKQFGDDKSEQSKK